MCFISLLIENNKIRLAFAFIETFLNIFQHGDFEINNVKLVKYLRTSKVLWRFYLWLVYRTMNERKIKEVNEFYLTKNFADGYKILYYLEYLRKKEEQEELFWVCEIAIDKFTGDIYTQIALFYLKNLS